MAVFQLLLTELVSEAALPTALDLLQVLASYGISGDISIVSLNEYERQVSLSLLHPTDPFAVGPAIRYCSPLPPSLNADGTDRVTTGADFVEYLSTSNTRCPAGAEIPLRRRDRRRHAEDRSQGAHVSDSSSEKWLSRQKPSESRRHARQVRATVAGNLIRSARHLSEVLANGTAWNPLGLALVDVGVDDRGYWKCYTGSSDPSQNPTCWDPNAQKYYDSFNASNRYGYPNPVFAGVDIQYSILPIFRSDTSLRALVLAWQTNGGAAPGLKEAGLSLRFTVDGNVAHQNGPDCAGVWAAPEGVIAFEYSFKTRIRIWNTRVKQLRVWLCCLQCSDHTPTYVSLLNVSDGLAAQGLNDLMPSPHAILRIPLSKQMNAAGVSTLQERLCKAVWIVLDERCNSRVWSRLSRGQSSAYELTMTFLAVSNSRIARLSFLVALDLKRDDARAQFPQIDFSSGSPLCTVHAPGPLPKATRDMLVGCVSHYDCIDGQFCSTGSLHSAAQGFLGGGGPGPSNLACDLCRFCISDSRDPNDRYCPRDKCGSLAGSYPDCIDASELFKNFTCKNTYILNTSRIPQTQKPSDPPILIPISNPNSTVRKARFLSPYNQLVGAVVIIQQRTVAECSIQNDSIGSYVSHKLPILGPVCQGSQLSDEPYGVDPTFTRSSTLYKGYVDQSQFYNSMECNDAGIPFGFFPHSFDGNVHGPKDAQYVVRDEASSFMVYFTERLSSAHAQNFIQYLRDGGFLDYQTQSIKVNIPTLNLNLNIFAIFTFIFTWEKSGKVKWDYEITSVPVYLYSDESSVGRQLLEIVCIILLSVNCCLEISDVVKAIRRFEIMKYFSLWNLIDLSHFALMWTGWYFWLNQIQLNASLQLPTGFAILNHFNEETLARLLLTNPEKEYIFLSFLNHLQAMRKNLTMYSVITSITVLLFILRCLKVADFQPRIALVTRTLLQAASDLVHFAILFFAITIGYSIAGVQLFGHQYEGFASLQAAMVYLVVILISWDPYQFIQLNHAAPDWIFHLYLWGWIILANYILICIFLAILVNGYMSNRIATEESNPKGLIADLQDILFHETQKVIHRIYPNYPYISDEMIISALTARCRISKDKKHIHEVLEQYHSISLSNFAAIKCGFGIIINPSRIFQLLKQYFPETVSLDSSVSPDTAALLDPTVKSVMRRFGHNLGPPDARTKTWTMQKHFQELIKLETKRRIAELHRQSIIAQDSANFTSQTSFSSMTLHVIIEQARNMPKMDLFRGADIFCVVFLDGAPNIFQTEIRSGTCEKDWVWDPALSQDFTWIFPENSELLNLDRKVVVMMYDKDQLSDDDLIGSVIVELSELKDGHFDSWRKVVRSQTAPGNKKFLFPVPAPELKLQIRLYRSTLDLAA